MWPSYRRGWGTWAIHGLQRRADRVTAHYARVATLEDGTVVGVRPPLAAHEDPIVRTYLAVEDIQQAVKQAEAGGALIA